MFERVVALNVTDEDGYRRYREGMGPILREYGGGFRVDFRVSDLLEWTGSHPVNRVFIIYFRDEAACSEFFSDERYLAVRAREFEGSVDGVTELARYDREG